MSRLALLMDEIAAAAKEVDGLSRTYAWPVESLEPPAFVVPWPDSFEYDKTYQGGIDEMEFPLVLVLGRGATVRAMRNRIADWIDHDVKDAIDNYSYTHDHIVHISNGLLDVIDIAGTNYLSIVFMAQVTFQN